MAGNGRYESTSGSPKDFSFPGNYVNGTRGNYSGASLGRPGSFREGSFGVESRVFTSGIGLAKVNTATSTEELLPLSQTLMLEPIAMMDQKYMRSGELRRILGLPFASVSEGNSSLAAHSRPPLQVATEELKLFKANVVDGSMKARARARKMNDLVNNLNKYSEALTSKKIHRNQLLVNEKAGGSNSLKMGTQPSRNLLDVTTHTLEDRSKTNFMNKRVRTSIAETRGEGRSSALPRQPFVSGKDRDVLKDEVADSDVTEDKIRNFPAGGEGWDKKMRRKRSVGNGFARSMDGESDSKRFTQQKPINELRLQSCEPKSFRLNTLEGNQAVGPCPISKGKGSRAARNGPGVLANSSPNFSCSSGELDGWEQSPNANKTHSISAAYNRKRPMPTGSSSISMAQWVGQKPKKNSRTSRTSRVSPVSNLDEMHTSSEGCSPCDFGAKTTSSGNNVSFLAKSANGNQHSKIMLETVPSPVRLSESEESGAAGSRLKDKGIAGGEVEERSANDDENAGPSLLTKKSKMYKEESGDCVRRQGRSGRTPGPRVKIAPMREKLDNSDPTKPLRNTKRGADKSGSKPGRPFKKASGRKSLTRLGQSQNYHSPDFTGDSDDNPEELSAAAKFASNSSYIFCPSTFWKKMQRIFGFVSLADKSDLERQIKSAQELHESLSQTLGHRDNVMGDCMDKGQFDHSVSGEKVRSLLTQTGLKEFGGMLDLDDHFEDHVLFGISETKGGLNKVPPLYQIVLSALILSDEAEECEEVCESRRDSMEFEYPVTEMQGMRKRDTPFCNGNSAFSREPTMDIALRNDIFPQGDRGCMNSQLELYPEFIQNDLIGSQSVHTILPCKSSYSSVSQQMHLEDRLLLELQSIGLYPEPVPDLAEGEDELISQEIVTLKKGLYQMADKKQALLGKLHKAIQDSKEDEERYVEQTALNRLLEMAYKRYLGTRGSSATKSGVTKLSKQADMAFVKRTLSRCHKYEETGKSCFREPPLQDVLLSTPFLTNDEKSINHQAHNTPSEPRVSGCFIGRAEQNGVHQTLNHYSDQVFANNGLILNRGKKREVMLDDVGGSTALRATSTTRNPLLSGPKGKRSEKDRSFIPKASRNNYKGERKAKSKPRQPKRTTQLSSPEPRPVTTHSSHPTGNRSSSLAANSSISKVDDTSKEVNDPFDSIDDLVVANDLVDDQDLSSWFNIDEDGLEEHDAVGLDIPMDDLTGLMF